MDQAERNQLIEEYARGVEVFESALAAIGPERLDARAEAGEWSPREIVHHLADSEMTSAIRLRRLIAEDAPAIVGYDEQEFARRLFYDRPIEASLAAVRASRETTAQLLERLDEKDWARAGTHSESGSYGIEDWLRIYARHAHDHAEQLLRAAGVR